MLAARETSSHVCPVPGGGLGWGIAPMRRANLLLAAQVGIEVVAGPRRRQAEPHRVDVVGALLERLHHFAARAQGGAKADRYGGLARGLVRRGDEDAAHATSGPASARVRGRNGRMR